MPNENEVLESKIEEIENSSRPAPAEEQSTEESEQDGEPVEKTEETSDTSSQSEEVDYKALLAESEARVKRAEDKIVKLKKQSSDGKEVEEVDEDRVAKLVEEQVGKLKDQVRSEIVESEVEDLLLEISNNPDERALIKHIYDHNLQSTGNSRADIKERLVNAKILANKQKLIKSNSELAEALTSKQTMQTARSTASASRSTTAEEPQRSPADQKLLSRMKAIKNR